MKRKLEFNYGISYRFQIRCNARQCNRFQSIELQHIHLHTYVWVRQRIINFILVRLCIELSRNIILAPLTLRIRQPNEFVYLRCVRQWNGKRKLLRSSCLIWPIDYSQSVLVKLLPNVENKSLEKYLYANTFLFINIEWKSMECRMYEW